MSIIDALFNPQARLLVGIADELDTDGSVRIYLNARYTGLHTHCSDPDQIAAVRHAWSSASDHITVVVSDDSLCDCPADGGDVS